MEEILHHLGSIKLFSINSILASGSVILHQRIANILLIEELTVTHKGYC